MNAKIEAFSLKVEPAYVLLTVEQPLVAEPEAKKIVDAIRNLAERRPLIILDLLQTHDIAPAALRTLMRVNGAAAEHDSRVAVVCKDSIKRVIRDQGLDRLLPCYGALAQIPGIPTKASKEQTREFLNTTLEAVDAALEAVEATFEPLDAPFHAGHAFL